MENPIEIKKIEPVTREFFDPGGNSIGFLNIYEFYDLRVQVLRNNIYGYHSIWENQMIMIEPDGTTDRYPKGWFDQIDDYLDILIFEKWKI